MKAGVGFRCAQRHFRVLHACHRRRENFDQVTRNLKVSVAAVQREEGQVIYWQVWRISFSVHYHESIRRMDCPTAFATTALIPLRTQGSHLRPGTVQCCSAAGGGAEVPPPSSPQLTRRSALVAGAAAAAAAAMSGSAMAEVNFDIDRYGDKELKVSTINSTKQNCRNILQARPELLPAFFMLGVHDALSYNAETNAGGPNGSLRFELDREENAYLKDAYLALAEAREVSRRDVSFADTFAFAGAVASELTSGPRIILQLGRDDAKAAEPPGNAALYKPSASADDLLKCFRSAGLNAARDVVLIHAAECSLADIAKQRLAKVAATQAALEDEDEDDLLAQGLDVDDVTYGRVTAKKRGAVLVSSNVSNLTIGGVKFSSGYLKQMLEAKKKNKVDELSTRDQAILSSSEMMPYVEFYASKNAKFCDDVANLFQRMSLLGSNFESLRLQD